MPRRAPSHLAAPPRPRPRPPISRRKSRECRATPFPYVGALCSGRRCAERGCIATPASREWPGRSAESAWPTHTRKGRGATAVTSGPGSRIPPQLIQPTTVGGFPQPRVRLVRRRASQRRRRVACERSRRRLRTPGFYLLGGSGKCRVRTPPRTRQAAFLHGWDVVGRGWRAVAPRRAAGAPVCGPEHASTTQRRGKQLLPLCEGWLLLGCGCRGSSVAASGWLCGACTRTRTCALRASSPTGPAAAGRGWRVRHAADARHPAHENIRASARGDAPASRAACDQRRQHYMDPLGSGPPAVGAAGGQGGAVPA